MWDKRLKLGKIGNKIFAKVRGYPHWPAVITNDVDTTNRIIKYDVTRLWYGFGEAAKVKSMGVCIFLQIKSRHGGSNWKKKLVLGNEERL